MSKKLKELENYQKRLDKLETLVVFEQRYWYVWQGEQSYDVVNAFTGIARVDSSYELSPDGLSIAIARCKYCAKRKN